MTTLIWQTALLLLGAYFLGAWVACLLRRTFFAETADVVDDLPPARLAPVGGIAQPVVAPMRRPDPKPITIEAIQRTSPQAAVDAASKFEGVLTTAPVAPATKITAEVAKVAAVVPPAVTVTPAAPPINRTAPAAQATVMPPVVKPASIPAPVAVAAPVAKPGDDLARIRAISPAMRTQLANLGVSSFRDIAAWMPADVARVSKALGFSGRIEQENWIEQAQILSRGGETSFTRGIDRGDTVSVAPAMAVVQPKSTVQPLPPAAIVAVQPMATLPKVETLAAFANQPKVLPAVVQTPAPVVATATATGVPGLAAAAASAAAASVAIGTGLGRDNLQRISGINAEVEKLLNVQGVSKYSHIAGWSATEAMKIDRMLGYEGRVAKESWIEQAAMLARGGDTAFSRQFDQRAAGGNPAASQAVDQPRQSRLADAIRDTTATKVVTPQQGPAKPSDIGGLRSVRSEAYVSAATGGAGTMDDLKRIRGVGVLIEKKLVSMGVTNYAQIANWSGVDIDRVSHVLDFKGRIERENWVEQARILSAGGQTEFSRRVDRGEVETSKNH